MRLTGNDTNYLVRNFPNIKLSYVKNIHKKVSSANIFLAIPKGQKYFAWFRTFKKYSVCILMEINSRKRNIKSIFIKKCCFDNSLCLNKGTILYGTIVNISKQQFFFIEDIYFYKGEDLKKENHYNKLFLIQNIFSNEIKQTKLHYNDIVFGLPIMDINRRKIESKLKDLPYSIYCIQHRYFKNNNNYFNEKIIINEEYERIFIVKAEIECDIYKLYYKNKNQKKLHEYKTALIPTYKSSVYLNSLFREIKENRNLDLLEESDDEEEFEDVSIDKFVNTEKQIKMLCKFNPKFKNWVPIKHLEKGEICTNQDINFIEKKYN